MIRHARVTTALARRFLGHVSPPCVEARALRSLVDFAIDNAREGCVRETYGAAVGHFQSRHEADAQLRQCFTRIAQDETRHAELSWDIDTWVKTKLSDGELREVERHRREALRELREELARPEHAAVQHLAGLPAPVVAMSMFDALFS